MVKEKQGTMVAAACQILEKAPKGARAPYRGWAAPVLGVGDLNTPRPLHRRYRAAGVGWMGTSARSLLLEAVCPLLCSAQLLFLNICI